MGCGMANDFQALGIFGRQYGQTSVFLNHIAGVDHLAIDITRQSRFGQACADRQRNICNRDRARVFAKRAIRQGNLEHRLDQLAVKVKQKRGENRAYMLANVIFP